MGFIFITPEKDIVLLKESTCGFYYGHGNGLSRTKTGSRRSPNKGGYLENREQGWCRTALGEHSKRPHPVFNEKQDGVLFADGLLNTTSQREARFDAFNGLTLAFAAAAAATTCVARLQFPRFHLIPGSGHELQYQPDSIWVARSQPWQVSTISWQKPPL
jgi:hypothetical protein